MPQADTKKVMGILCYLGILIIVPFLMAKDDPHVKFHLKQGAVLFLVELIVWVVSMTMFGWQIWPLLQLVNLAAVVLSIVGIVNVLQGHEKELPLVGSFGKSMPI